jgi:hypothetical protein
MYFECDIPKDLFTTVISIMSQKTTFAPIPSLPIRRKPVSRLGALGVPQRYPSANGYLNSRRATVTGLTSGQNAQRTSKTTQKLVVLPLAPQARPIPEDNDLTLGYETDGGIREYKNAAERMSKDQRKQAEFSRLTAYCVAESFKMNLLSSFLKREHNVSLRIFDKAIYAVSRFLVGYWSESPLTGSVDVPPTTPTWLRPKRQRSILKKKDGEITSCSPFRGRRNWVSRLVLYVRTSSVPNRSPGWVHHQPPC